MFCPGIFLKGKESQPSQALHCTIQNWVVELSLQDIDSASSSSGCERFVVILFSD